MIDRQEVIRMARLARLELSEEELELYQRDLTNFLVSGKKLQQVDVSEIEGSSHAVSMGHELRQDQVGPSLTQAEVLAAGSRVMDGFFKVPRIVEGHE
ncbi:MAG: Asp-tRNA(Asn)/Glu-tRNA(Gln) amidotransferase subunit GatC [Firmicutes bacterium]|nr:Asp-tRNA(Asn)/Glu-tRNA(Gln) amidotransferase subunit GatC [Bacillota bacterium]